jgi:hypothetical protein
MLVRNAEGADFFKTRYPVGTGHALSGTPHHKPVKFVIGYIIDERYIGKETTACPGPTGYAIKIPLCPPRLILHDAFIRKTVIILRRYHQVIE